MNTNEVSIANIEHPLHEKAVMKIVDLLKNDPDTWNGGDVSECFGWDGGTLSPVSRAAFVGRYGEDATKSLEDYANAFIDGEKDAAAKTKYAQHEIEAVKNLRKAGADLSVGDFIMCYGDNMKFDHENIEKVFKYAIDYAEREHKDMFDSRICCITRIEEVPDGFFDNPRALSGWKPQENEGGSRSDDLDDLPDDTKPWNLSKEQIATFYTLGVLVREPSGRCVVIDPEGYDYPRYIYFRNDYMDDFKSHIETAKTELAAERDAAAKEKAEKERKAKEAEDALVAKYDYLPIHGNSLTTGEVSRNLRAALKHEFPGVKFRVHSSSYSGGDSVHVSYEDGPAYDDVDKVVKLFDGRNGRFTRTYGWFSYAHTERTISAANLEKIGMLYDEKVSGDTEHDRNRRVYEIASHTTFDGREIVGLVFVDEKDGAYYGNFDVVFANPTPPTGGDDGDEKHHGNNSTDGVTVTENTEKNGIEIRFTEKPDTSVLSELKAHRWRWSKFARCWYNAANEYNRSFAQSLASRLSA